MSIEAFILLLAKVETITDRDKLIMLHAYEIGFRHGVTIALKEKE